ncbi:zinc finger protein 513-like [Penaeus indicus]|uniref:zinc finger protein 513-like n=1 Tax=Penaeus indicus TaxID=29960 RepID=UPI00300D98B8
MKKWSCNVKKFECTYCSYFTVTSTNLMNHMRTHTGEKPYACAHCPYRSTQKGNLRTHINKHHQSAYQDSSLGIEARRSVRKSVATTTAVYLPAIPFPNAIPQPLTENVFKVQTNNDNRNLSVAHPTGKTGGEKSSASGKETPRIRVKVFDCEGDLGIAQPEVSKGSKAGKQSSYGCKKANAEGEKAVGQNRGKVPGNGGSDVSADGLLCQIDSSVSVTCHSGDDPAEDVDTSNLPQITSVRSEAVKSRQKSVNCGTIVASVVDDAAKCGDTGASLEDEVAIAEGKNPSYREGSVVQGKIGSCSEKKISDEVEKESDIDDPVSCFAQKMSKLGLKVKKISNEPNSAKKSVDQSDLKEKGKSTDETKKSTVSKGTQDENDALITVTSQPKT